MTLKLADLLVGVAANTRARHLLRLAPETEVRHRSNEFDYTFRTNHLGLRGPDVPFEKHPGTFRIVVVGDSFVAGYGVAAEHLLTTLLQDKFTEARRAEGAASKQGDPAVEVVNVGRVGTSTIRELDLYQAVGRRFHPDLVILAYYLGNDLAEVVQEQTHRELAAWHPDGWARRLGYALCPNLYLELAMIRLSRQQLREFTRRTESEILDDLVQEARARGSDPTECVANFESLSREIRRDVASGALAEQRIIDSCIEPDRLERALDPRHEYFARAWQRTADHLDLLQAAVARDGARLVVVVIPAPFQVDRQSLEFHRALGYVVHEDWLTGRPATSAALEHWSRDTTTPLLDLTERFRNADCPLYFIEDQHFTPAGHAEAAEAIFEFLHSRKLSP